MSQIVLKRVHGLGRKQAARRLEQLLAELREEYAFEGEWDGGVLHIVRGGAKGEVHVCEDLVEVKVTLGALLRPLRRKIQERIEAQLEELFPTAEV